MRFKKPSNTDIEEKIKKNEQGIKELSDQLATYTSSKAKMDDLAQALENKRKEKEEKEHTQHQHQWNFQNKNMAVCADGKCGERHYIAAVPDPDDWNKEKPDPELYAEPGFDPTKVHDIYKCSGCGTYVRGPKRKDIGIENKLDDCPFCKNDPNRKQEPYFVPVDLHKKR